MSRYIEIAHRLHPDAAPALPEIPRDLAPFALNKPAAGPALLGGVITRASLSALAVRAKQPR